MIEYIFYSIFLIFIISVIYNTIIEIKDGIDYRRRKKEYKNKLESCNFCNSKINIRNFYDEDYETVNIKKLCEDCIQNIDYNDLNNHDLRKLRLDFHIKKLQDLDLIKFLGDEDERNEIIDDILTMIKPRKRNNNKDEIINQIYERFKNNYQVLIKAYNRKINEINKNYMNDLKKKKIDVASSKINLLNIKKIDLIDRNKNFKKIVEEIFSNDINYLNEMVTNEMVTNENKKTNNRVKPKRKAIPKHVQREVWRRDKAKCVFCESNEKLEFDHIIPISRGGSNTSRNIQLLCEKCNRKKSNKI